MLGFQLPERLADRDMAGIEFAGDMVLPERRVRCKRAADNATREGRRDPSRRRYVLTHRLSIALKGARALVPAEHEFILDKIMDKVLIYLRFPILEREAHD